ncbi:nickel pincer cofactor biosynthesis protein LarB [Natranaerobius thermophilus]|uniref:NCAIR mutase (PurE)-related protein n=1 Tax=Natranaerobius thermophilus (strain ATCC BAA-1301 / DSM 18059 / JW/NM-WN-LF) TaxID=457570 RepID=B2A3I1_NATTJ|nr:nickel pincer cofactor biosynthesis protein LarB [Natranaerobius thermophilus]ACB86410.1 NCAIR mutase (PurE)-related protein [Natranaerobius thermophilus JW/NM-WN-LF]
MKREQILEILNKVSSGNLEPEDAANKIKQTAFEDLGYAKIDHHRSQRQGFPEVIYCQGKEPHQVAEIFQSLVKHNDNVLATRASDKIFNKVRHLIPQARYNDLARTIIYQKEACKTPNSKYGKVALVSAGTSDLAVAEEAFETAQVMGAPVEKFYDVGVAGIHRLLNFYDQLTEASCVIVVAGMEGALASVVGGLVDVPVIACPTSIGYGANFNGLSSMLTMLNSCASGVSVVNIDNGFGAGYQAALISKLDTR